MIRFTTRTSRLILSTFVAVVGLSSVLAACGGSDDPSSTSSSGLTKIRIGVAAPTAEQTLPAVAQELGFFKAHGIEADVQLVPGGPQITAGLVGGSLDFGVYSAPGPEVAAVQGAKIKYVGVWTHRANLGLVVAPGIDSVKDLKGQAVAVSSPGTTTAIYTDMLLREAGMDATKDVVRRNVGGQGAALSAFASGQVKAAIFGAPVTYTAVEKVQGAKILIDYAEEDFAWPYAGIVAGNDYAKNNPETISKVLAALKEAAAAYKDPAKADDIISIISKFTSTTDTDAVKQSFDVAAKEIDVTLTPNAEEHQNVLTQLAFTTPAARDFKATDIFDASFLESADDK
jgi:NitT/TauT family transport system substrate-binding protein